MQRKESKNIENCDNVNRLEIEKNLKYLSLGGVVWAVWPEKNSQMCIKVAQKWFH